MPKKPKVPSDTQPEGTTSGKKLFKQELRKPQPWSFGGRGNRSGGGDVKARPDAERLAGKNRKVH